jgi:hypothetical protein
LEYTIKFPQYSSLVNKMSIFIKVSLNKNLPISERIEVCKWTLDAYDRPGAQFPFFIMKEILIDLNDKK